MENISDSAFSWNYHRFFIIFIDVVALNNFGTHEKRISTIFNGIFFVR